MRTTVKFAKIRPEAKIPTKREEDAGFDIYACFDEKTNFITIAPHETKMIATGLACACDKEYCIVLKERGSTGTKGLAQRCGIIDSGYRNEIFVPLTNTTEKTIVIAKGDTNMTFSNVIMYPYEKAICQALVIPVPETKIEECSYEELQNIESERGMGKLGSSGK